MDRWLAAQELLGGDGGAPEGHERDEHRRDESPAGRAHLAAALRPPGRLPRVLAAHHARRERGDAHPRPRQGHRAACERRGWCGAVRRGSAGVGPWLQPIRLVDGLRELHPAMYVTNPVEYGENPFAQLTPFLLDLSRILNTSNDTLYAFLSNIIFTQ